MSVECTVPSLLDDESVGGDHAESGFEFQQSVLMTLLPQWLGREGFTALIRESYGDLEAQFYVPGQGLIKEFVEVKNHHLAPKEFWSEIQRFQTMAAAGANSYRRFTLVSTGISEDLKPLRNGLRRVRDPYLFYNEDATLQAKSYDDYKQIVLKMGRTEEDAQFLFRNVFIESDYALAAIPGAGLFCEHLCRCCPEYSDVPNSALRSTHDTLTTFLKSRKNTPVTRLELERLLRNSLPAAHMPPIKPIMLYTVSASDQAFQASLRFEWTDFFGGNNRSYPPSTEWNEHIVNPLLSTRDWISANRLSRHVRLEGSRRLSASLALGSVFSAVAGYTIEMNYRGETWASDLYPDATTPEYYLNAESRDGNEPALVVSISIVRSIAQEVDQCLPSLGIDGCHRLHLQGGVVTSPQHGHAAVQTIKREIISALSRFKPKKLHLFYAGPSHIAIFLGHRLNALAPIQCYEWKELGVYSPTCVF